MIPSSLPAINLYSRQNINLRKTVLYTQNIFCNKITNFAICYFFQNKKMHRTGRLAKIRCFGSKSNILTLENFKFAENVAHFLILNRNGGGRRIVILPIMQPSRLKTRKLSICSLICVRNPFCFVYVFFNLGRVKLMKIIIMIIKLQQLSVWFTSFNSAS